MRSVLMSPNPCKLSWHCPQVTVRVLVLSARHVKNARHSPDSAYFCRDWDFPVQSVSQISGRAHSLLMAGRLNRRLCVLMQAKEAREAAEACAAAAAAARAEADAAAKEGAAAGRDFASRVGGLTAAAAAARDALSEMLEAEEGGRAAAEELQGILGELGNATKVRSSICVLNSGLTYVLSTDCLALFWLCRLRAALRSSWQCLCRARSRHQHLLLLYLRKCNVT